MNIGKSNPIISRCRASSVRSIHVGIKPYGLDVLPFSPVLRGGSCTSEHNPPTCAAVNVNTLPWQLHGQQTYYVTLLGRNSAGLSTEITSLPYFHVVDVPLQGLVWDIDPSVIEVMYPRPDISFESL